MPAPVLKRSVSMRGPKFYHDGGVLMFINFIDGSTQDGPRVATHEDMTAYPLALINAENPLQAYEESPPSDGTLQDGDADHGHHSDQPAPEAKPAARRR